MAQDAGPIEGAAAASAPGAERVGPAPSASQKGPEPSPGTLALVDLVEGLVRWRLWGLMGWQDIRQRYRRSVLGPFWLTLSMAVLVSALGVLYGKLFGLEIDDYLPFLALGFIVWGLISGIVNDGCVALTAAESFIKQMRLPFSLHVYRVVWRNLIVFAHNFVVYLGVIVVFGIWPGAAALLVLPGLALIVLNAVWIGLLLGTLCARFRDIPQIVASLMRIAFFMTPIIWKPEMLGRRIGFAEVNPFYHFVELVRAPLLGGVPAPLTWAVVLGITVAGWLVAGLFFRRFRARIAYWV